MRKILPDCVNWNMCRRKEMNILRLLGFWRPLLDCPSSSSEMAAAQSATRYIIDKRLNSRSMTEVHRFCCSSTLGTRYDPNLWTSWDCAMS